MDINFTRIVFLFMAASMGLVGLLINSLEKYLPIALTRSYRYGKFSAMKDHAVVAKMEVPKRWFAHFYRFAAPASSFVLALTVLKYIYGCEMPSFVYSGLDLMFGSSRQALLSPESTLLATILLTIQCWKRWYETHYVTVFSDAKMNFTHYMVGFTHYLGTTACMIGESEGFVRGSRAVLRWDRLTNLQYICAGIFLWASLEQLRSNYILANLRKNPSGVVVTKSYAIPEGRLFKYISSPLQFTEILMYTALSVILWKSSTYHTVWLWVLVNQAETATLTHLWYLEKFENYPKTRKIFIPHLL